MGSVVMFENGAIVDFRSFAEGKPALLFKGGSWTPNAESNPDVPIDDLKDAIVLSEEDIAELNTTGKLPQSLKRLIGY